MLLSAAATAMEEQGVCYIYISPKGCDGSNGGLRSPVRTLDRVQEILEQSRPRSDVVVRIRSDEGVFINETVHWTYHDPLYSITFESYPPEYNACFLADEDAPPYEPFFTLDVAKGEPTNIVLRRLTVRNYVSRALYFFGDRENLAAGWNGHNVIEDCTIIDIGNGRMPERNLVYGAVTFLNSRFNVMRNCYLIGCANADRPLSAVELLEHPDLEADMLLCAQLSEFAATTSIPINAVYIAHHSSHNRIKNCKFWNIHGDAIRIRDASDHNIIGYNRFMHAGRVAVCTMWYCYPENPECTKSLPECPSHYNELIDNWMEGNWNCYWVSPFYDYAPRGSLICPPPDEGVSRILLENNMYGPCPEVEAADDKVEREIQ
jgi:hypothetical protein